MSGLSAQDVTELERLDGLLKGGSYYDLFGLKDGYSRDDLKKAYYALSRRFHPDRFYRQDLGPLQARVEEVFAGINEGYRVLGDESERQKYDRERVGAKSSRRPPSPPSARAPDSSPRPEPPRAPEPPPKPVQEHVVSFTPRAAPPPPPPRPAEPPPKPAEAARVVPPSVDRLKAPFMERLRKAKAHFKEGKEAADAGNWPKAASAFYMAYTFDPKNPEYERLFRDADPRSRRMQAEKLLELARKAESYASTKEALINYQKAADLDPPMGEPFFRLAKMLGKDADTKVVMGHLRKAAEKEPNNVEYRVAFAKALEDANLRLNAAREYKAALELKPDNAEAKEGLKRTR